MEDEDDDDVSLPDLPEEILLIVFSFLKVQDVIRVGCTCHLLHDLTSQDVVWRPRFRCKNDHLLLLPTTSQSKINSANNSCSQNNNLPERIWKRLYLKASFALSFRFRTSNDHGERTVRRVCDKGSWKWNSF